MAEPESTMIELEVRRLLAAEVKSQRDFLAGQFKMIMWSIGIVLVVALAIFFYVVGKTRKDLEDQLGRSVSQAMLQHQIDEDLQKKLNNLIQLVIEREKQALQQQMVRELSNKAEEVARSKVVSDAVAEQVNAKAKEAISQGVLDAVNSALTKQVASLSEKDLPALVSQAAERLVAIRIDCKTVERTSTKKAYPAIEASISNQEVQQGYVVMGGGCAIPGSEKGFPPPIWT